MRRISSLINLTRRHYLFSLRSLVSWGWHGRPPQSGGEDISAVCNHQKEGVPWCLEVCYISGAFQRRGWWLGTTTAWAMRVWGGRWETGEAVMWFQTFPCIDHRDLIKHKRYDFPWTEFPWQNVGKLTLLDVLIGHLNTYWMCVDQQDSFKHWLAKNWK